MRDLRFAVRAFVKTPVFTAVAVATLALGIGANTAIFSVVNGVLLKALPYRDADRIVVVWERNLPRDRQTNVAGPANFLVWRDENHVFENMAAVTISFPVTLTGAGEATQLRSQAVNAEFFPILGVNPEMGRTFTRQEEDGHADVVVISHRLWQERLKGAPLSGQSLTIDGRGQTVVGVMPADFHFRDRTVDLWSPIGFTAASRTPHGRSLIPIARLRPGVSIREAQAEMDTISARLSARYPQFDTGWVTNLVPLPQEITGDVRPALLILLGAVGFVLLIACANVANLLLARSTARQRELAVRSALGADRSQLVRQLLTESLALAAAGGALGLALAWAGVRVLATRATTQAGLLPVDAIGIDGRVLAFTALAAIVSGLVFGLTPALTAVPLNLTGALKEGGRGGTAARGGRARSAFVVIEIALAVVLLVGAGLLMRSFARLMSVNPGFDPDHVLTLQLTLPSGTYRDEAARGVAWRGMLERLAHLPGVQSVGAVSFLPMNGLGSATNFSIVGQPTPAVGQEPVCNVRIVAGDYFRAQGIPIRRGRVFTSREQEQKNNAIIINETLATRFFPNQDPIGKRLSISWNGTGPDEIVGVVGDIRMQSLDEEVRAAVYYPYSRTPYYSQTVVIRAAGDPLRLAAPAAQAVRAADPDVPVSDVRPMTDVIARAVAQRRVVMTLLGVFAGVALLLASVGIYGVMSYAVSQRTQEIGIRMALGARRGQVVSMVLSEAARLAVAGLLVGAAAAWAVTGLMRTLLYDVQPTDPATFAGVMAILAAVAAIASSVPALRATRVDPLTALRAE